MAMTTTTTVKIFRPELFTVSCAHVVIISLFVVLSCKVKSSGEGADSCCTSRALVHGTGSQGARALRMHGTGPSIAPLRSWIPKRGSCVTVRPGLSNHPKVGLLCPHQKIPKVDLSVPGPGARGPGPSGAGGRPGMAGARGPGPSGDIRGRVPGPGFVYIHGEEFQHWGW